MFVSQISIGDLGVLVIARYNQFIRIGRVIPRIEGDVSQHNLADVPQQDLL